jgi:uncharacterized protein YbjT (DUF2867 family)
VRDVAAAAAGALLRRDWQGHTVREVPGPRDLSYAEATRILGARLGRPDADYVRLPAGQAMDVLAGFGFSADTARHYVEFGQALAAGRVRARGSRTAAVRAGLPFEAFADQVASAMTAA